jgi:Zn-dependent protease
MLLPARNRTLRFSPTEIQHLTLGTVLVAAAGVDLFVTDYGFSTLPLIIATLLFAMGFILHELAHKYVAQRYGLWAEFRVNTMGVILTAISVISPLKFIAPGAVVISGFADKDRMGWTAIAGPIVNIVITIGLLVTLPLLGHSLIASAVVTGAAINAYLALFNLIPFAIFDGRKVYVWNRRYWAIVFIVALILTAYTYIFVGL